MSNLSDNSKKVFTGKIVVKKEYILWFLSLTEEEIKELRRIWRNSNRSGTDLKMKMKVSN